MTKTEQEKLKSEFEREYPDLIHLPEGGMSVWLEGSYMNGMVDFWLQIIEQRERELVEKILKIIDDNDPQTDNKVNPIYWGATLRQDIQALLSPNQPTND